jgi:hypothetical protein
MCNIKTLVKTDTLRQETPFQLSAFSHVLIPDE